MQAVRQVAGFCVVVLAACGGREDGGREPAYSVRDSAGIEIVEVVRPQWLAGEAWRVSADPLLEIGQASGEEPYQLYRVTHAVRLANGSIVAANGGTQELRWFDAQGRFVRRAGGRGGGPGEFSSLVALRLRGDTLWAHDLQPRRATAFDTAGALVRTVTFRGEGLPTELWPVPDGFVAHLLDVQIDITPELTWHRRTARYLRFDGEGVVRDTADAIPGLEFLVRGGPAGGNTFVSTMRPPLVGHTSLQTVVGDRFVAGITDRFEIRVYDGARLVRLIRDPSRDRLLTDAEWNEVLEEEMADAETPEQRRVVQQVAELRPKPEWRPAYNQFFGDRLGYLWVAPYRPTPGQPVPWLVIDIQNGAILGDVDLPEAFRPRDIGADYVLGIVRDEYDVERLVLYGLERGGSR